MRESLHSFKSGHLQNERPVWIREPLDRTKAFNLAIFLDAEIYRGPVGASGVISELEAADAIANTLAVFVSFQSPEARWRECPCHPPFAAFMADELLPWIGSMYPSVSDSEERVLVGLSYTGLAAAFVAMATPGKFTKVIAQSGSFWWNDCWLAELVGKMKGSLPTGFYLDVGLGETAENVRHKEDVLQVVSQIRGVRSFRDALLEKGHKVNYREFDGGHDCAAWKAALPDALRWGLAAGKGVTVRLAQPTESTP